ncbi:AAA family ATPase [Curtobacterium pusillum]|uniref:AAA family ATPase n=1 Tax=Curtobacterium pusillum TaxID=69373 RepID=UPI0021B502EA|nr:AAA family ATPase [Curtobacterium pusillum]
MNIHHPGRSPTEHDNDAHLRLRKVAITNHSRIQDLNLEIRRHAVIVGANDVGKSSILRMLNLLLGLRDRRRGGRSGVRR